jgi:BirA family biotin operon repressor/biotin-[acetyl-CoA-carboxylase] ligase
VADVQAAGRGRGGNAWVSEAGDGLWFTLLERDVPAGALSVLSLRAGLAIARIVAPWCDGHVGLKWPNDVLVLPSGSGHAATAALRKLAGVLVEARWREGEVDWVAIGVGVNLREPSRTLAGRQAAALRAGAARAALLEHLVPLLRDASADAQELRATELRDWAAHDVMHGRACVSPAIGVVQGIAADGTLRIATGDAGTDVVSCRSGSLILAEEVGAC